MGPTSELLAIDAFKNAASRVPAYRMLLREAGIRPEEISTPEDFRRLPVLGKHNTFQRFGIQELCIDGILGQLGTVLTSSGHSGVFAFGLTDSGALPNTVKWIDDALDFVFAVRSRPTLLINCLPMGVKVPTQACTLAETSVRPDMVVGLVKAFGRHFAQIILVGEPAFLKHVLETGKRGGVEWRKFTVHIIAGEEVLAENARRYLSEMLGHDLNVPEQGMVFSSMGVAELGLNLFFEVPPVGELVRLRRALHEDRKLRHAVLGSDKPVPSLFTYDPQRVFVEFEADRLIVTTLGLGLRIPLIRYATGDRGAVVCLPADVHSTLESRAISWEVLNSIPIVAISGRGEEAMVGIRGVSPESVKEGLYEDPTLAQLTTANFRLVSDSVALTIRIQLSPGVRTTAQLTEEFRMAISMHVSAPFSVKCEEYDRFRSGMALDYERKFTYLDR